jgi:ferrochelatase
VNGEDGRGALLMTYGSPASLERDDVRAYLARVRGGRQPDPDLVDEFTRRYRVIGGSPLVEITRVQATTLAGALGWPVEIGMRFSEPSILTGLSSLAEDGVTSVAAIVLSPQFSPLLMGGYAHAIDEARAALGDGAPDVHVAGAWHEEPAFVDALAGQVVAALAGRSADERRAIHVLMTAHSLPKRVADQEPDYLAQLRATAEAVAARAGLTDGAWTFCWQSAGHEPGEWMKPDFADLMPEIAASGARSVLVVPVQFLADHLEILYDIDIGAREQAERCGLDFFRIESLNAHPALADALGAVARRTLEGEAQLVQPGGFGLRGARSS